MGSMDEGSYVDVLISGAGPSGMMASMYLSELGIEHRIIDKRGTRTLTGRADGFHIRTMEIWDSFGLADKVNNWGPRYGELSMWTFGEDHDGIKRLDRQDIAGAQESRLETGTLHQGFIEAALIEGVRRRNGPTVERGTQPVELSVDAKREYPVAVKIRHSYAHELEPATTGAHTILEDGSSRPEKGYLEAYGQDPDETVPHVNGEEGSTETIHAKYMIGTDGAHSWVRNQLPGIVLEGENTDSIFGVVDIIPFTDFPDIRKICAILSKKGYLLVIPRELGMVRLYVQFPEDWSAEGKSTIPSKGDSSICAEILDAAQKMLEPYKLDYKYCDWWTVYRIGQRVANHSSYLDKVFLAGDAIHTHSPKGGQGMNVSQQDTYNLTWKIAGVLHKQLSPSVLPTYEQERIPVANALIELDKHMAKILTARANRDEKSVMELFNDNRELNGTKLCYQPNAIQPSSSTGVDQSAASNLTLGSRFPDAKVYGQAQGSYFYAQALLKSTGVWRILIFAGDVSIPTHLSYVNSLGDRLLSLLDRYPAASSRQQAWAEVFLLHSNRVSEVEITDFHDVYFPPDEVLGRNYYRVYGDSPAFEVDVRKGETVAHEVYGIDAKKGALVLVRPDQTVSWVSDLGGLEKMEEWLESFMLSKRTTKVEKGRHDSGYDVADLE